MENSWLHARISRRRARVRLRACLQFSFTQTLSSDVASAFTHSSVHAILYTRYSAHLCSRSRLSSAGIFTAAWLWNRGSTHTRSRDLYILSFVLDCPGVYPVFCSMLSGLFPRGYSGRREKLTVLLRLMPVVCHHFLIHMHSPLQAAR